MRYEMKTIALGCAVLAACVASAMDPQSDRRLFKTPEAAVDALVAACETNDSDELIAIFGPVVSERFQRIDDAEERTNRAQIATMAGNLCRIEERSDTERMVLLGYELWPFPMPIVFTGSGWQFDTEAGIEELQRRRIGQNELAAIEVCRTYVDAQYFYAESDRDSDGDTEFAQKILSTPGHKDGLYWKVDAASGEARSPLGPFLAAADAAITSGQSDGYMGYRFKVITSQGRHAPGGRISYLDGGELVYGFALIAWPSDYGHSGVTTFIVNHLGAVYEKNLGARGTHAASRVKRFDPDPTWILVENAD